MGNWWDNLNPFGSATAPLKQGQQAAPGQAPLLNPYAPTTQQGSAMAAGAGTYAPTNQLSTGSASPQVMSNPLGGQTGSQYNATYGAQLAAGIPAQNGQVSVYGGATSEGTAPGAFSGLGEYGGPDTQPLGGFGANEGGTTTDAASTTGAASYQGSAMSSSASLAGGSANWVPAGSNSPGWGNPPAQSAMSAGANPYGAPTPVPAAAPTTGGPGQPQTVSPAGQNVPAWDASLNTAIQTATQRGNTAWQDAQNQYANNPYQVGSAGYQAAQGQLNDQYAQTSAAQQAEANQSMMAHGIGGTAAGIAQMDNLRAQEGSSLAGAQQQFTSQYADKAAQYQQNTLSAMSNLASGNYTETPALLSALETGTAANESDRMLPSTLASSAANTANTSAQTKQTLTELQPRIDQMISSNQLTQAQVDEAKNSANPGFALITLLANALGAGGKAIGTAAAVGGV